MTNENMEQLADMITEKILIPSRWLKLKQATKYANYGKTKLMNLAMEGKIKGYQDKESKRGDWIFDKKSIDEFRLQQFEDMDQTVKEILACM